MTAEGGGVQDNMTGEAGMTVLGAAPDQNTQLWETWNSLRPGR